jgi:tetratricopeptide (TPR) repeat protein
MAKKKSTPPDEGPKPRGRSRPKPAPDEAKPESLPPASEAKEPRPKPGRAKRKAEPSPLDQARELAIQAAEAHDPRRTIALAKQALALSPDCAEAYYLLADHARTRKEALNLFEQAVAAAGRVLGPEFFVEGEGHFWGLLETRPYMRARLALAEALWSAGRRVEAAEHLGEMLRLNPGDNQGVRYIPGLLALESRPARRTGPAPRSLR